MTDLMSIGRMLPEHFGLSDSMPKGAEWRGVEGMGVLLGYQIRESCYLYVDHASNVSSTFFVRYQPESWKSTASNRSAFSLITVC